MILLGGGEHGQDLIEIAHRLGIHKIAVYDDADGFPSLPADLNEPFHVGVNCSTIRRSIAERYPNVHGGIPLIDPSAIIGSDVVISDGCVVSPLVSLLHSVTLGRFVHVNTHANIVRAKIGAYTTISPGANICGTVTIGEGCLIGAGSTVAERCTIGNDVTIGAGAVVPPYSYVNDGSVVVGVYRGPR